MSERMHLSQNRELDRAVVAELAARFQQQRRPELLAIVLLLYLFAPLLRQAQPGRRSEFIYTLF